jgi:hypothetical protein
MVACGRHVETLLTGMEMVHNHSVLTADASELLSGACEVLSKLLDAG